MAQKITPFLWFEKDAKKVAEYYTSIFKDSKIKNTSIMEDTPSGTVEIVAIELFGQDFTLMSAGPLFKFTEAISFVVDCKDQEEVDYYWEKLIADGGEESACGWLKDKYGLSWQIIPQRLNELISDPDKEKAGNATQAMLKMKKIIVADLEKAFEGK
ncbi:MAG: VOC family protein [Candidatus Levybacteria bacterium]|nr:VOC family protein [Candidatus Levybacteria bacterium]